ncbi:transcriptional regulator, LysR family [Shimia gijangensis]|uniref:Transcriptional regulator, LysR family n=1 Tax=Shimia gijangensis TaxID=1470563 RepID=A0A1M6CM14_9RHOB|nr:LysR family transcriptional regulator [Shimia gijangensis]SHI62082.1 transcriptional regulator, LysR family [Shimia gijangensis]
MDRLDMMRAFVAVAREGGFSPAARQLDISTSALSRYIAALEEWLNVQLFFRTTRHVRLTDAGQGYLARCLKVLDDVRELEQVGLDTHEQLSGNLRIAAPLFYGREFVAPVIAGFLQEHRGVSVDLFFSDRLVDLVAEGFDLAVRVTKPKDSAMIARKLSSTRLCLVASPGYLELNGLPGCIEDLAEHQCIVDQAPGAGARWEFSTAGGLVSQKLKGQIQVNDGQSASGFAMAGLGIARLPKFFVESALSSGQLVEIKAGETPEEIGIFSFYPPTRHLSRNLRALVTRLADEL